MGSAARSLSSAGAAPAVRYQPPTESVALSVRDVLPPWRPIPEKQQARLRIDEAGGESLYAAGNLALLQRPSVALVGTRQVSPEGLARTRRLARELVRAGVVVVSGLAQGVDAAAHQAAIEAGGSTIAVIGTALDRAYPVANAALQETIYREHLLVSPFVPGAPVHTSNWPHRNKIMAALSDATVIIEASDTSGTIHQASECLHLGRMLFILRSVVDDKSLTWPDKFIRAKKNAHLVHVLESTAQLVALLPQQ